MKFAVVSGFLVFISEALKILNAPPLTHSWNVFSRLEGVMHSELYKESAFETHHCMCRIEET